MISGKPGPGIEQYTFAVQARERYLAHIQPGSATDLLHYKVAGEIGRLAREEMFVSEAENERLVALCEQIHALYEWPALIEAGLNAVNRKERHAAILQHGASGAAVILLVELRRCTAQLILPACR